ncbi:TolC family outer membrane protein [Chitinilyticum litopenaei]|uniref:TolC family outer membrane protein n=1 Tax=Chitinilyticum litopenaei TaxID=1121276 RepID=UPI00041C4146|nr:TolC family outer membrane protein [Chitinilyticum litopenaei]
MPTLAIKTVGGAVLVLCVSQGVFAATLRDAVEQTIRNNPDVQAGAAFRQSTDEAVKVARGGYFPKVDVIAGTGSQRYDSPAIRATSRGVDTMHREVANIRLSQMLFDGMGVKNEVLRNESRVNSAAYKLASTSEQSALRAAEAYLEVLRNQELVTLAQENLKSHEKAFDQIKMRSDGGFGKKSDEDQMAARLALAQSNLLAAEGNLSEAEFNYRREIGVAPEGLSKPDNPPDSLIPASVDEAAALALASNPIIKSAQADVDAARAQNEAAKSLLYPRLDVEADYAYNRNVDGVEGSQKNGQVMLMMRWNLFQGGSHKARVGETQLLSVESREIANRVLREVEQSARLSYNAYKVAQLRLPSLKQHAVASEQTRDAYLKQFSLGQRTLLDLLDSENEFYTARTEYVNGVYTDLYARYRIAADSGRLLEVLGVPPREETLLGQK